MKSQDKLRTKTLRMLLAAIQTEEVSGKQARDLGDDEVIARVKRDLTVTMGIDSDPSFVRVFRHPQAIPQYTVGHGQRLRALDELLANHPGLFLTGNSYRGIGLNDCVAAAERSVDGVMALVR